MSDGPLYSPTMNKPCQRLAKACGNDAASVEERVEFMEDLAIHSFKKEGGEHMLQKISDVLHSLEGDLFQDNRPETLDAIRNDNPNCTFSQSLLDNVIEAAYDGLPTTQAIEVGLGNTFQSRVHSEGRSIVEHCLGSTEVSHNMATKVGSNLNQARTHFQTRKLARNVIENGIKGVSKSRKKTSVNEGPSL